MARRGASTQRDVPEHRTGSQTIPRQRAPGDQRYRDVSSRRDNLSIAVASSAVPAINASRYRPVDHHAAHDARLFAVVIDRLWCVARLSQITTSPGCQRQRTVNSTALTLLLGFFGALRRSELVALNVNDLEETEDGFRITIGQSKTDQEGKGQVIAVIRGGAAARSRP